MLIDDTISKRVSTSSWHHVLPEGITPDCVIISVINVAVEVMVFRPMSPKRMVFNKRLKQRCIGSTILPACSTPKPENDHHPLAHTTAQP
jgi:hypothetical protein